MWRGMVVRTIRDNKMVALLFWLVLSGLFWGCAATAPVVQKTQEIGAELRCPVCGVHPAEQPRTQCQMIMGDGQQVAFDSARDMFSYLQLMDQFGYAKNQGVGKGLAQIWVHDYNSGAWLDGKAAWYVAGSDVRGPVGKEIYPFAERSGAEDFSRVHGGKVVAYAQIDATRLKMLKE